MITLFRANDVINLKDLKGVMQEHIRKLPQQLSFVGEPKQIMRFELPTQAMSILGWLHNNQTDADKFYWSDRQGAFQAGGLGVCDLIDGEGAYDYQSLFEHMRERLSDNNPHLRYYGGFNFDQNSSEAPWQPLGSYRFFIPRFEFFNQNENTFFAFNIAIADVSTEYIETILTALDQINFDGSTSYRKVPAVLKREDVPDQKEWTVLFNSMVDGPSMRFEKIVLARKTKFTFDTKLRPMALVKHLKDMAPDCFHFCFQTRQNFGFLGASPERLFKRAGQTIETEALAATAARGQTPAEDEKIASDVLQSAKNKAEHQFVVDELNKELGALCTRLEQEEAVHVIKLDNGQHLKTSFLGMLLPSSDDAVILKTLHPTPAVAGCPKADVLKAIEETEPFNRGWYAAPVGYVGFNESEFAVAIRSGLVDGNTLSLFAGAGIVKGSKAQEEWDEIENKIGSFIKVFNQER